MNPRTGKRPYLLGAPAVCESLVTLAVRVAIAVAILTFDAHSVCDHTEDRGVHPDKAFPQECRSITCVLAELANEKDPIDPGQERSWVRHHPDRRRVNHDKLVKSSVAQAGLRPSPHFRSALRDSVEDDQRRALPARLRLLRRSLGLRLGSTGSRDLPRRYQSEGRAGQNRALARNGLPTKRGAGQLRARSGFVPASSAGSARFGQ